MTRAIAMQREMLNIGRYEVLTATTDNINFVNAATGAQVNTQGAIVDSHDFADAPMFKDKTPAELDQLALPRTIIPTASMLAPDPDFQSTLHRYLLGFFFEVSIIPTRGALFHVIGWCVP
jgi:hypothetical protein